jgi:hypothetical protein
VKKKAPKQIDLVCSFCGLGGDIVSGPCVYICRDCVRLCAAILQEKGVLEQVIPSTVVLMKEAYGYALDPDLGFFTRDWLRRDMKNWLAVYGRPNRKRGKTGPVARPPTTAELMQAASRRTVVLGEVKPKKRRP